MNIKVGLIDPALRRHGHHASFMSYLYNLLKQAGISVRVADFGNILRQNAEIDHGDLMNLSETVPTELFGIKRKSPISRLLEEYRKYLFYKGVRSKLDDAVDVWIISTYDHYALPLLYYSGLRGKKIIPIVHYSKTFRKSSRKLYGLSSFWRPHLLFSNLCTSAFVLHTLEEHDLELKGLGFHGRSAYLPYNALSEASIDSDNRGKLSSAFSLCTVGIIRDDKDIKLVMNAVNEHSDVEYFVGGKIAEYWEKTSYMSEARKIAMETENITAIFRHLSAAEYIDQIEKSHFSVIPINDKYAKGGQQTGLLLDSLVNKRPVIGPDIFPINKLVNDYKIGLLYEPGNQRSLSDTIRQAKERGVGDFYGNICEFLRCHSVEYIAKMLGNMLEESVVH